LQTGQCSLPAEWTIIDGQPAYDHYTHACGVHVGEMLTDGVQTVYPTCLDTTEPMPCCFIQHRSDCAVHNAPALPAGPCTCGAIPNEVMQ